jgi:fructuronate reductase/mannitol 2-dehydrogenase
VTTSLELNERNLPLLAARATIPTYARERLAPGVVHISVGSFHRAHQALYFEEIAARGLDERWGITGVGLHRREMKAALDAQDGLYTVVTRSPRGDDARIVGVITRYLFAPEERAAVLDALADERTRLVTLTITAAGYKVHPDTGAFLSEDDAVVEDLARPSEPGTALGLLVEALDRRRRAGRAPFTVLSCDNMADNGTVVGAAVVAFASLRDERLGRWIEENVAFPGSMVDRITPGTTDADRAMVERTFGIRDRWPVMTEPYSQWVVEDRFCQGRPPLDEVGVQLVDDVRPYALTKTRLLNASHSALGYLGSLAGYGRIDEVMADPVFAGYIEKMMVEEIAPLLPRTEIDLSAYGTTLRRRFANPAVADRLSRLCRSGSTKVPAHLLSSVREALQAGRPHALLTLAVAGWCRYLRAVDASGRPFPLDDANGERLRALAGAAGDDPRRLLADEATFGSLGSCPAFVEAVERDLRQLEAIGSRAVIRGRITGDEHLLAS